MTRPSRNEIIAALKQLKEGDVLIGGHGSPWFIEGEKYPVYKDENGDLFIRDKDGDEEYINYRDDYINDVYSRVFDGILLLPELSKPFSIVLGSSIEIGDNITEIRVLVDSPGRERLEAMAKESRRSNELPKLLAQKAEIEEQIKALTEGDN